MSGYAVEIFERGFENKSNFFFYLSILMKYLLHVRGILEKKSLSYSKNTKKFDIKKRKIMLAKLKSVYCCTFFKSKKKII